MAVKVESVRLRGNRVVFDSSRYLETGCLEAERDSPAAGEKVEYSRRSSEPKPADLLATGDVPAFRHFS
jgi:hypothetical protein